MNTDRHPWTLTGPWYRWKDPSDSNVGRQERPAFQKYDSSDLVREFLADPQRSLKFIEPDDIVQQIIPRPAGSGPRYGMTSTGLRKLYLDTHKRFYLVVCELHCDEPGFPNTTRDAVCEAGFVVRRRQILMSDPARQAVRKPLQAIAWNQARLAQLEEMPPGMKLGARLGVRAGIETSFRTAQSQLEAVALEHGVRFVKQGWVPGTAKGVGSWQETAPLPQSIDEQIFPLYPLVPDPAIKDHSSGGRTLYFGLVPTGSSATDTRGNPQFDDRSLYEIRCFVRRHHFPCPKLGRRNDCHGALMWSLPTEPYQLAAPFDLTGTSHRPINILMPDLPALEAQAARLKPGQGAPVRLISPAASNLPFSLSGSDPSSASPGAPNAAICSFSIPLITLVASFVFRLFLPIVTLLFGLWFLLKLKFCIPPSLELNAGLALQLDAIGGIDTEFDADLKITGTLLADLKAVTDPATGKPLGTVVDTSTGAGKKELFDLVMTQSSDFSASVPAPFEVSPPTGPGKSIPRDFPELPRPEYEARIDVHT